MDSFGLCFCQSEGSTACQGLRDKRPFDEKRDRIYSPRPEEFQGPDEKGQDPGFDADRLWGPGYCQTSGVLQRRSSTHPGFGKDHLPLVPPCLKGKAFWAPVRGEMTFRHPGGRRGKGKQGWTGKSKCGRSKNNCLCWRTSSKRELIAIYYGCR